MIISALKIISIEKIRSDSLADQSHTYVHQKVFTPLATNQVDHIRLGDENIYYYYYITSELKFVVMPCRTSSRRWRTSCARWCRPSCRCWWTCCIARSCSSPRAPRHAKSAKVGDFCQGKLNYYAKCFCFYSLLALSPTFHIFILSMMSYFTKPLGTI